MRILNRFIVSFMAITSLVLFDLVAIQKSFAVGDYPWQLTISTSSGKVPITDFAGKPIVLSFFSTHCQNACPVQTLLLRHVQKNLARSVKRGSTFVSISIDSERDTVATVDQYAEKLGVDMGNWVWGVAQDKDEFARFLKRAGIDVSSTNRKAIDHTMAVLLIDHNGRILQRYVGTALDERQVVQDLTFLIHIQS